LFSIDGAFRTLLRKKLTELLGRFCQFFSELLADEEKRQLSYFPAFLLCPVNNANADAEGLESTIFHYDILKHYVIKLSQPKNSNIFFFKIMLLQFWQNKSTISQIS
jgi:hypothetical protein